MGLRRRSIDVVTVGDLAMLGAADEQHLQRAIELNRVVVSCDQDFLALVKETATFPGLIYILPGSQVGEIVRAIDFLVAVLSPAEMTNVVEWVP